MNGAALGAAAAAARTTMMPFVSVQMSADDGDPGVNDTK